MIIESIARLCALRNEIERHEDVMRGAREPEAEQRGKTKNDLRYMIELRMREVKRIIAGLYYYLKEQV